MTTTHTATDLDDAGKVFVDPSAYANEERFHGACAQLRRDDPIHLVEHPDFPPFWALTKHPDVYDVELHPDVFNNAPFPVLGPNEALRRQQEASGGILRTLIHYELR